MGLTSGWFLVVMIGMAVSWIAANRGRWSPADAILLCVSGRGDKDVAQVSDRLELSV